jgi:kumamolisin
VANHPSVLCISWGKPESVWSPSITRTLNQAFHEASTLGITVVSGTGDGGVTDGIEDGGAHIDFPASSPYVLAVGGTRLVRSGGRITSEIAWNDRAGGATGGGVSVLFLRPDWQSAVNVPARTDGKTGRGIPDVSANAAPASGYLVYIDGQVTQVGGTSASGPLWAGLIALINQGVGHNIGYINPLLYKKLGPNGVLRDITEGDNGADNVRGHNAVSGWDASTGWGSPSGRKLLGALRTP